MKTPTIHCALVALTLTLFAAPPKIRAGDLLLAAFSGDAIVRYDSTGGTFSLFASHATMDGPAAMVYGADGNLYVLCEFSHRVLRFHGTTGAFIDEFISPGTLGAAGVTDPDDMELGSDGNLYITNHFPEPSSPFTAIFEFSGTAADTFLGDFASFGAIEHTHGLTFGPGGKLFLGGVDSGSVYAFDGLADAVPGTYAGTYRPPSGFITYGDLAFTPDGNLYLTHGGGVLRYDGVSATPLITGGGGYWGVLVDDGFLYLSNLSTGTLKKYTDTGVFVADITGGPGAFDIIPMVPEPGAGLLMLAGLASLGLGRRRG